MKTNPLRVDQVDALKLCELWYPKRAEVTMTSQVIALAESAGLFPWLARYPEGRSREVAFGARVLRHMGGYDWGSYHVWKVPFGSGWRYYCTEARDPRQRNTPSQAAR